jgi:hypothetical protein
MDISLIDTVILMPTHPLLTVLDTSELHLRTTCAFVILQSTLVGCIIFLFCQLQKDGIIRQQNHVSQSFYQLSDAAADNPKRHMVAN